jgi:3-methyladenine DNA glycosylase AlkD
MMATPSAVTERATALVADRRPAAEAIGRELAALIDEPDTFAERFATGFRELADPDYAHEQRRVAPGLGRAFGVRWPLMAAVERGFRSASRRERVDGRWLHVVDRLFREPELEHRWFAFGLLDRLVLVDPERAWQLLRRAARDSGDWITVDALAHPVGRGVLSEPYRWAELEQLVYSPSRWERRLVGSTIATIPYVDHRLGREVTVVDRALPIVRDLMGDSEADVQKALAWALRSLAIVDRLAVERFLDTEAETAAATSDGHRAWVIRDVLPKLDPVVAADIRSRLEGIRRRSDAPATSRAADTASRFADLPLGARLADPPLI